MPLWVSDFLGDTLDLDATEIGAYMLLLMAQWNRDGNSLPDDHKKLQRVARCGRNWGKVWGNVERYFDTDENGIYSKRLRLEAQNVAAKREVNARNGALGGKAKALNSNDVPLADATETLKRNPSIPEPEPYSKKESTNVLLSDAPEAIDDVARAVSAYNEAAQRTGWPVVQKVTPARRAAIKGRLTDAGGLSGWEFALGKAEASRFLRGETGSFRMTFDFLSKSANFTKLMEGNYDDRTTEQPTGGGGAQSASTHATSSAIAFAGGARRSPSQDSF